MAFAYHMTILEKKSQMGEALVERYLEEGIIFPSVLRMGLLTTAAIDNIDQNPSSTTVKSSFYGSSISIFQHPINNNFGKKREMHHIPEG